MIDFLCTERQYIDHCAPIWFALDPSERGSFVVAPRARAHAALLGIEYGGPPGQGSVVVVASYADERRVRRRPVVLVEHGAGQSYGGDGTTHPSYSGGSRHDVALFLCPNPAVAARWRACYPHSRVEVVGAEPRMDRWYSRAPGSPRYEESGGVRGSAPPDSSRAEAMRTVVAFAPHWDCRLWPESRNAWPTFSPALGDLTEHFAVLGHGHPRILRSLVPTYAKHGIEVVEDFDEVVERAHVLVCDNSSVLFEFASLDRPVVLLNAPSYRRDVEHGLRFWRWAGIGPQVDDPERLVEAVKLSMSPTDGIGFSTARRAMADEVYPRRDGLASVRAADAIRNLLSSPDARTGRRRSAMPAHDPFSPRRSRPRRLPEARRDETPVVEAQGQALTGVVQPLTEEPLGIVPGSLAFALFVANTHSLELLRTSG